MNSTKLSGVTIVTGGALLILVNALVTPMLDLNAPFPEMMGSRRYLWRLILAAFAVFFLMVGCSGLHAYQSDRSGFFGRAAFALAFLGCAFLFAHEWAQVFYVHSLAVVSPEALQAIEDAEGVNLYDAEAMIALLTFTLGWIASAVSMMRAKVFSPLGPILIIAGFFATPLLTVVTSVKLGGALGNAVLGSGFIMLGFELLRGRPAA